MQWAGVARIGIIDVPAAPDGGVRLVKGGRLAVASGGVGRGVIQFADAGS